MYFMILLRSAGSPVGGLLYAETCVDLIFWYGEDDIAQIYVLECEIDVGSVECISVALQAPATDVEKTVTFHEELTSAFVA